MTWTTDLYDLPETIRYCTKCAMPNTRPGVTMDGDGVCSACRTYEARAEIDWPERWAVLERLCGHYRNRRGDGEPDCLIAVSSGKDSAAQVALFKEPLGMTPALVSVGNLETTAAGEHNARWLSEEFGCHLWEFNLSRKMCKVLFAKAFERSLMPTMVWDLAVYSIPVRFAANMKIPLLIYGENIGYEYSGAGPETSDARDQISNGVVRVGDLGQWVGDGVTMKDLAPLAPLPPHRLRGTKGYEGLRAIYMSYFVPWSGYEHAEAARARGWWSLDDEPTKQWDRQFQCDAYDQIDSASYWVHPWAKFPKLGHRMNTDRWCNAIREGRATRAEAVEHIVENEHKLDPQALDTFLAFVERDEVWFWDTVDRFANRRMLEKVPGRGKGWRLNKAARTALKSGGVMEE